MVRFSVNHTDARRWTRRRPAGNASCIKRFAMIVLGMIAMSGFANAHTADETRALAERAVAHSQDVGCEQAFADFSRSDGGFVNGGLYVFCLEVTGVVVAYGGNPKLAGENMMGVRGPNGRLANVEVIRLGLSQGSGWVEFRWPDPVTKRIEREDADVLKVDDQTGCGSRIYKKASS
jgi:cytochrome c